MTCRMPSSRDGCSFDTFVSKHGLDRDPAIVTIAAVVRGADPDRHDLTPQSAGLLAVRWDCETHNWPPAARPASA
nr:chromate resistance protein ChrB domain-containing protein [Rhizobium leguminosarum]